MLLAVKAACNFWSLRVSPQLILRGALDLSVFKRFLGMSFVVHSMNYMDIAISEMLTCNYYVLRRFDH